jgi:ribosomal-protein-alanine N-acetyltransferase
MIHFKAYTDLNPPDDITLHSIATFLHQHLDAYGDPLTDIEKAIHYALKRNGTPGGLLVTAWQDEVLTGAVVLNKTGMKDYIPENILVYIATHNEYRGKGLGRQLMQQTIEQSEGDIALHVEPDNPAKKLYEQLGFTNKYLEMRLKKEQ